MADPEYRVTLPIQVSCPVRLGKVELVRRLILVAAQHGTQLGAERVGRLLGVPSTKAQTLIQRACDRLRMPGGGMPPAKRVPK